MLQLGNETREPELRKMGKAKPRSRWGVCLRHEKHFVSSPQWMSGTLSGLMQVDSGWAIRVYGTQSDLCSDCTWSHCFRASGHAVPPLSGYL